MNNADFRALVSGPQRFELKQVEQWDKELRRKEKQAEKFSQKRKKAHDNNNNDDGDDEAAGGGGDAAGKYRNRAEERRRGDNPDYDEELAKLVEQDVEKSKFLGGDEKFTHLVRGLDHALLAKVKRELQEAKHTVQQEQLKQKAAEYTPTSALGRSIKAAIHGTGPAKAATRVDFSRMAFEYDVSATGAEVPLIFQRSRIESSPEDTLVMFAAPQRMMDRVTNVMHLKVYHLKGKKRRKKTESGTEGEKDGAPQSDSRPAEPEPKRNLITSIFDDDIGVYVPPGALETKEQKQTAKLESSTSGGYFTALKAVKPSEQQQQQQQAAEEQEQSQYLPQHTSEDDLTEEQKKQLKKSLRPFLNASQRSQSSSKAPLPSATTTSSGDLGEGNEDDEVEAIRRQIEARKRAASGAGKNAQFKFADYDGIYPDTAELEFSYESDEEGGSRKRKKDAAGPSEPPKAQSMAPDDF